MARSTRYRRLLPGLAIVLGLLADAAWAGPYLGKVFPDFEATDAVTGRPISLRSLRGKAVLVDFWATWCGPCKRELPNIQRAYEQFHDEGLEIVSISLDHTEPRFKSFLAENPMNWHHVMEGGGWRTRLAGQYRIRSIPKAFMLDRDGVCISDRARGTALVPAIRKALASGTPGRMSITPSTEPLPDEMRQLLGQLGDTRVQLTQTIEPVRLMSERLAAMAQLLQRIERALPRATGADAYIPRLLRVQDDLHKARHRLFMLGVLGEERTVPLPAESAEAMAADRALAGRLASRMLASIEVMTAACAAALEQLTWLQTRMGDLREQVAGGRAVDADLRRQVGELHDHALELSERWCEPWLDQVGAARRMLAVASRPRDMELAELDALSRELSRRLEAGDDLEDLRLRFSDLARRALATQDRTPSG